ncbi:RNA methyltransferase [Urechidicola sp. KH5]
MLKTISSVKNPLIKEVIGLQEKSRNRKKQNRFIIEGQRELSLAISGNYKIEQLLIDTSITSTNLINELAIEIEKCIEISHEIFKKIAYRNSTEGVIAIVRCKNHAIDQFNLNCKNPLILVAEATEKPGNIGALMRTADAANVDAIFIANSKTDLYNPNIIRSSVGCVFTNNIITGSTNAIIDFLKSHRISIFSAVLSESAINYTEQDYTQSTAIVVGTEATGLSDTWLSQSDKNIIIPMLGSIDSMNVSVAAGILIYEAKRQRNFK